MERLFSRSEAEIEATLREAEERSGRPMPDLNAYVRVLPASGSRLSITALQNLAYELGRSPEVIAAYVDPVVVDAGWVGAPGAALSGSATRPGRTSGPEEETPDFSVRQRFMDAAPYGVGARAIWSYPGARGEGVRLVDVETGFNWPHEDLGEPFYYGGDPIFTHHGCAVIGVLAAVPNEFGVTGMVPEAAIGSQSHRGFAYVNALDQAASQLEYGDVLLIEGQTFGPGGGYVPVEYNRATFERIEVATARGIVCVEAAGNGSSGRGSDLDDPAFGGVFDRAVRNSGAIIVGASRPLVGDAIVFSNYGSRVDLNAWGSEVVTSGYGWLHGIEDSLRAYTDVFNGTSASSAIVAGAVVSLQGAFKAETGHPLPPSTLTRLLQDTGSPDPGPDHVGPRPDLERAIPTAVSLVTVLAGTLRAPEGATLIRPEIKIVDSGERIAVDDSGRFELLMTAGEWRVVAQSFGYASDTLQVSLLPGETLEVEFELKEQSLQPVRGYVFDGAGRRIAGAPVWLEDTPLPSVQSRFDGAFAIPNVPNHWEGVIRVDDPRYAPDATQLVVDGESEITLHIDRPQTFEHSDGDFIGTNDWEWARPIYPNGPPAFSGDWCWVTNANDAYTAEEEHNLVTPVFDLSELSRPRLSFRHWYEFHGLFGSQLEISLDGGATWYPLAPLGSDHAPCLIFPEEYEPEGYECEPGFSGESGGWRPVVVDLAPYAAQQVRFRFHVAAAWREYNGPGWYVDDFQVFGAHGFIPAFPEDEVHRVTAGPNPTQSSVRISFELPDPRSVAMEVFDVSGRRVRRQDFGLLSSGGIEVNWDGRDDRRLAVPSGVYWIRLLAPDASEPLGRTRVLVVR